jgi:hypothetical protein
LISRTIAICCTGFASDHRICLTTYQSSYLLTGDGSFEHLNEQVQKKFLTAQLAAALRRCAPLICHHNSSTGLEHEHSSDTHQAEAVGCHFVTCSVTFSVTLL